MKFQLHGDDGSHKATLHLEADGMRVQKHDDKFKITHEENTEGDPDPKGDDIKEILEGESVLEDPVKAAADKPEETDAQDMKPVASSKYKSTGKGLF